MIKTNNLRKGNKVYYENEFVTIDEINYDSNVVTVVYPQKSVTCTTHSIEPIPILSRTFGILNASRPFGDFRIRISSLFFIEMQIGLVECDENYKPKNESHIYRYIHQIQNLYFEQTGEELPIFPFA